ncbi:MAG: thioredoxin [Neisseriaceae bacterium]|nr:thioredoxin [Neisseriaceae bacterium PsAf]MCV2502582.1 thioredoxin [Neisseriaceae bacterium]MCV2509627.1 thioredoxin [Neisseriaceae bacterium]
MSEGIVNTTDQNFEADVLKSDIPVLVDFWAPWCGPCRMVAPVLEDISKEYAGKIKIVKLDVEENQQVASQLGIRNIPTMKIYKNGEEVATKVGALGKPQLAAFIDASI